MKKAMLIFPLLAVFVSPWMHRAAYENMMIAIPDLGAGGAHALALCLCLGAGFVSAIIAVELQ